MGILCLGYLSGAEAQTIGSKRDQAAHAQFRSFYKSPNKVQAPAILQELDRTSQGDWTNRPPIVGFMAGLLIHDPTGFDLLPSNASYELRRDFALALSLAGRKEQALAVATQIGLSDRHLAILRAATHLHSLTVHNPTDLDYLWGAAFATGDPRYVHRITMRFVELIDSQQKADDVLAASQFAGLGQGDLRFLQDRYDQAALLDIVLASAMLGGLTRNAAEHDFVRNVVIADFPKGGQAHRIFEIFSRQR